MENWFDVDKAGLASILERRGKAFALFELVQNAWDAGPSSVVITLEPLAGAPFARLKVEDDSPEGWTDLRDAFTMFGRSRRAADATKRGRFCLGEKLVLALCREAEIITTTGAVRFSDTGRRQFSERRERGTLFIGQIRMTREELRGIESEALRLIPPVSTTFNGSPLARPTFLKTFEAKLPTEIADVGGNLRRGVRLAQVEAFVADGTGDVLELGIPVCAADWPWRLNVLQKVPLGMERDSVAEAFRRALQVAAVNALADTIDAEHAAAPWASEAIGDSRITPAALRHVVKQRFGDRAVVGVPGDPIANATAEAAGCEVIHGGAFSADAWSNIRKHATVPSTSQAFPTPRPSPQGEPIKVCPLCKQQVM